MLKLVRIELIGFSRAVSAVLGQFGAARCSRRRLPRPAGINPGDGIALNGKQGCQKKNFFQDRKMS